jgi:hypothetical protein
MEQDIILVVTERSIGTGKTLMRSDFFPDPAYSYWEFSWIYRVAPGKCRVVYMKLGYWIVTLIISIYRYLARGYICLFPLYSFIMMWCVHQT